MNTRRNKKMSNFMSMLGNYESRKIGRTDYEWGYISTAEVNDGRDPYETAVCHTEYTGDGDMAIVESYATRALALEGHKKWVTIMTAEQLPDELVDCANADSGQLLETLNGGPIVYRRKKTQ